MSVGESSEKKQRQINKSNNFACKRVLGFHQPLQNTDTVIVNVV